MCPVEAILGDGMLEDTRFFKVKWVGYPEPTWEPAENVEGADDAIAAFLQARTAAGRRSRSRSPRRGERHRKPVAPRSSGDVTLV